MSEPAALSMSPALAAKFVSSLAGDSGKWYGSVAVALSGGIDSTVVAKAAFLALGDRALAVTADSASVPRAELADAVRLAGLVGIAHHIVRTAEFDDPDYLRNDGSRCYFCKSELYRRIEEMIPQWGAQVICSGANLDDLGDYRPGLTAAAEHLVRHPLLEAGRPRPMSASSPGSGVYRPGTSRLRRACRRGWRRASPSRTSAPPGSKRPRFACASWAIANAACACTTMSWPASKSPRTAWPAWPTRMFARPWSPACKSWAFVTSRSICKDFGRAT